MVDLYRRRIRINGYSVNFSVLENALTKECDFYLNSNLFLTLTADGRLRRHPLTSNNSLDLNVRGLIKKTKLFHSSKKGAFASRTNTYFSIEINNKKITMEVVENWTNIEFRLVGNSPASLFALVSDGTLHRYTNIKTCEPLCLDKKGRIAWG